METKPPAPYDPLATAEQALTDAGIAFTVVDRCPAPNCPLCAAPAKLATAA